MPGHLRVLFATAALLLLLLPASGTSGTEKTGKTIAFSHPAAQAGVVAKVVKFAQAEAKRTGNKLVVGAFEKGTPDEQFRQIETWITQGVDAIHVFPLDPASLAPLQKRAQAKGIKWITYLIPMPGADGLLTVPAKSSGNALAKAFNDYRAKHQLSGTAIIFQFSYVPVLRERIDIPAKAVEAAGFKIVAKQDIIDTAGALTATENALRANPDLRVAVAITDDAALGANLAFKNAGVNPKDCFVAGADGTLEALQAIKARKTCYKASAAVDIRVFGQNVVDVPLAAIAGKKKNATVRMQPVIVTADTPKLLNDLLSAYK